MRGSSFNWVRGRLAALVIATICAGLTQPTLADEQPIAALKAWIAGDASKREDLAKCDFAKKPLTRDDAKAAAELLWSDHAERIKKTRAAEMKDRQIKLDGQEMPFWYKVYGDKPATGRGLFISLHGGGNAAKAVNDSQWENQKRLYQPKEGVYLCPRAATNTWNLWHEKHIDALFGRLIENLVVFEDVDPNRVYVMGYSAGGDGVYQLAPRMADRWAAAAMMAGHPNEASPLGLRNVALAIHVGERDSGYNRNKIGRQWGEKLDALRKADPGGYVHETKIHAGKGHWMDRQDAVAVEWMAKHARDPSPTRVVWKQDDVTHSRFYWLAVDSSAAKRGAQLIATRDKQRITLESTDVSKLSLRLNDQMLDLDQPVTIAAGGKDLLHAKLPRTIATLAKTLAERGDPKAMFSAEATVTLPNKAAKKP